MTFENTLLKYREYNNGDKKMVDGINFNGKIGQINNINGAKAANIGANEPKVGTFGYGFKSGGVGFERNVVPQYLTDKFADVESPKYHKNIAQLQIADKDYIPDKAFEEQALCEV